MGSCKTGTADDNSDETVMFWLAALERQMSEQANLDWFCLSLKVKRSIFKIKRREFQ